MWLCRVGADRNASKRITLIGVYGEIMGMVLDQPTNAHDLACCIDLRIGSELILE